jgi:hypothetical protein
MTSSTEQLAPALDVDARLTGIEFDSAAQRDPGQRSKGVGGLRTN